MKALSLFRPSSLVSALSVSLVLALLTLFLILTMPVHAQDEVTPVVTEEATEVPPVIIEPPLDEPVVDLPDEVPPVFTPPAPNEVLAGGLLALFTLFASAIASPLTAPIVSLVKRIPYFSKIDPATNQPKWSGDQVNLLVAMLLSVVAWGAASLGFASQLETIYKLIFAVLPILTAAGGNFVANQSVYRYGVKKNMPLLGYSRTAESAGNGIGTLVVEVPPGTQALTSDVIQAAIHDALRSRGGQ